MPMQKDVPVTPEIGKFIRPEDALPGAGIGAKAINSFIAGKTPSFDESEKSKTQQQDDTPDASAAKAKSMPDKISELESALDRLDTAPEITYAERVKKHDLTLEDALTIISEVFDNGFYEKTYQVTPKHSVTFRTRTTSDQDRVLRRIESDAPQYPASISQLLAKYNIAASIVKFKGEDLSKRDFEDKYKMVANLPEVVLRLLSTKLIKFDQMMLAVLDEGAVENF